MKKILMDFSPFYIQSAYTEGGRLKELVMDSGENRSIAGNIYAARIKDVVKGQFAFCDIGQDRPGFLQLDDFRQAGLHNGPVHSGMQLILQAVRDPVGEKGAYLSANLSFPGKYLILTKGGGGIPKINLSHKIMDETSRSRLMTWGKQVCPDGYGMIVRTAAENICEKAFAGEADRIYYEAESLLAQGRHVKAPALLSPVERVYTKTLKYLLDNNPDEIVINNRDELDGVKSLVEAYGLPAGESVKLYEGGLPLFAAFGIDRQAEQAGHGKVWLKSGAFLLIEQAKTAALIDVNTGKFKGKKSFEETAHFVNMEAAAEIALQIRLKNISGVIIIDFINTQTYGHQRELEAAFSQALEEDRNPARIAEWGKLNLVQLTRKRMRPSLGSVLTCDCPVCDGSGQVKAIPVTADKVYKEVFRILSDGFYDKIYIMANRSLIGPMANASFSQALEGRFPCSVELIEDNRMKHGYYTIEKHKKD